MNKTGKVMFKIGIGIILFACFYLAGLTFGNILSGKQQTNNQSTLPEKVIYDQRGYKIVNGQRSELSICMDRADEAYTRYWNSNCKSNNLENDCSLPQSLADKVESSRDKDEDQCIELFKN